MSAGEPDDREDRPGAVEDGPQLRKPSGDGPPTDDGDPGSIWHRLDGREPAPPAPPFIAPGPWTRDPDGPAAHHVAAAYAAAAGRPGGVTGAFTLATWPARLGAYVVDMLIFATIALLITVPLGMQLSGLSFDDTTRWFSTFGREPEGVEMARYYVALTIQRLVIGLLGAGALLIWKGQSPGKKLFGLRVMRADGLPLGAGTAIRREVVGRVILLDLLTFFTLGLAWVANYLLPIWDRERRAGHDVVARTRVVKQTGPR